jgi:hypothetical protein
MPVQASARAPSAQDFAAGGRPRSDNYRYTVGRCGERWSAAQPRWSMNWLTWEDGIALADWAGLRPMSKLEFEMAAAKASAACQTCLATSSKWRPRSGWPWDEPSCLATGTASSMPTARRTSPAGLAWARYTVRAVPSATATGGRLLQPRDGSTHQQPQRRQLRRHATAVRVRFPDRTQR